MRDFEEVFERFNWQELKGNSFFVTGATGTIGSFLINSLIYANEKLNLNLRIYALVRDGQKARGIFKNANAVEFIVGDVVSGFKFEKEVDFVIHGASNTASASFVEKPVETLQTAFIGTQNVLNFALKAKAKSVVYLSSMEAYGVMSGEADEEKLGFIALNSARSSYPIGKRVAENLAFGFFSEFGLPVKVARLSQTFSSQMDFNDSRLVAYIARCVVKNEDIVLKTQGLTVQNICYATDAILGILTILLKGKNGETYNVSNEDISLQVRELAKFMTKLNPCISLKFDLGANVAIYPPATSLLLKCDKLRNLGWSANIGLKEGFGRLICGFREQYKTKEK